MGIHWEQILTTTESIQLENASGTIINPSTDETLATLQSMLVALERIASQSPRLTRTKEINVAMDNFWQAYTTSVINTTSNPVNWNITYRTNEVNYFSNMGANHLYRNIN